MVVRSKCVFSLIIYCSSCWSTWWYGHSFGQRTMMQTYPLLALPLGTFIHWIGRGSWRQLLIAPTFAGIVLLSVFQAYQFKIGTLHGSRMTKEYYWAIFGKMEVSQETKKLMLVDRDNPVYVEDEFQIYREFKMYSSFEEPIYMCEDTPYSEVLKFRFNESTNHYYAWYKVEADVLVPETSDPNMILITTRFFRDDLPYGPGYHPMILQEEYVPGKWFHATAMYLTPTIRRQSDRFEGMIWNRDQEVYFKNFMVSCYVKK